MTKRILAILLTLAMVLSLCSVEMFAANGEDEPTTKFVIIKNSKSVHTDEDFSGPTVSFWGNKGTAIKSDNAAWDQYIDALTTEGAKFVIKYKVNKRGSWFNFLCSSIRNFNGDGWWQNNGHINFNQSLMNDSEGKDPFAVGSHTVYVDCASYVKLFGDHACRATHKDEETGEEVLDYEHKAGDFNLNDARALVFQAADDYDINITDLYILVPKAPEAPEAPDGYETSSALKSEAVEEDGAMVITPTGNVKTEGVLVSFNEPAPDNGEVIVVYGEDAKAPAPVNCSIETIATDVGQATRFGYAKLPSEIKTGDTITVTVEGSITGENVPDNFYRFYLVDAGKNDNALCDVVYPTVGADGKINYTAEVTAKGNAGYIQFKTNWGDATAHVTIDKVTVVMPYEKTSAESVTVPFKKGDTFVEIPTSAYKSTPIIKIVVKTNSGELVSVAGVKVKDDGSSKKSFGYAIRLSNDYHGYLVNGRMLPMPHKFNSHDTCTVCGYHKAENAYARK